MQEKKGEVMNTGTVGNMWEKWNIAGGYGIRPACKIFRINMLPGDETKDMEALNDFLSSRTILLVQPQFVPSKVDHWLVFVIYYDVEHGGQNGGNPQKTEEILDERAETPSKLDYDESLAEKLRAWRSKEAKSRGWPAYIILYNKTIEDVARKMPTSLENLLQVEGANKKTIEEFSSEILGIVREHIKEM